MHALPKQTSTYLQLLNVAKERVRIQAGAALMPRKSKLAKNYSLK